MANFNEANKNVNEAYANVQPIIEEVVQKTCKTSDDIIKKIGNDVDKLSKEELRKYIIKLSAEIYTISDVKERASIRKELAETIYKETNAKTYGNESGTSKERENKAYLSSLGEKMAEVLHSSIESRLKTKINSINIVIENLKSVLISRISEDKNINNM